MVYAILLERLERHVHTERVVNAVFIASGRYTGDLPDFTSAQASFDAALAEEVAPLTADRAALLEAVGLR